MMLLGRRQDLRRIEAGRSGTSKILKNKLFCPEPDIAEIIALDGVLFGLLVPDRFTSNAAAQRSFN
jgi:hypothetical protein